MPSANTTEQCVHTLNVEVVILQNPLENIVSEIISGTFVKEKIMSRSCLMQTAILLQLS